jgi:hypothetical protein
MSVANNLVAKLWRYDDLDGLPVTGQASPGDVTLSLFRETASGMVAASETVSWDEIGSDPGYYTVSFTPENTGQYVIELEELNYNGYRNKWEIEVTASGAVFAPSYSNAYCSEADIEGWLGQPISSSTTPSDNEAAKRAEEVASILSALCTGWGFAVTPDSVTAGSRLQDMLRRANAIRAAVDYVVAQQFGTSRSLSEKAERLERYWTELVGDLSVKDAAPGLIEREIRMNLASLATDQIISGAVTAQPSGAVPTNEPIGIGMGESF